MVGRGNKVLLLGIGMLGVVCCIVCVDVVVWCMSECLVGSKVHCY